MKIIHYTHPGSQTEKYDNCISAAPNGNIYALSWYLNITCPDWEFLSTDDFSTVMPLPVFKSLGRKILRQPEYTHHLGVFSSAVPGPDVIQAFLDHIPSSYRLKNLFMNKFNLIKSRDIRYYNAFELDLIRSYRMTSSLYSEAARTELQKAKESSLSYMGNISAHDLLMFAYRLDAFNKNRLKPTQLATLRLIASTSLRYRAGQIAAAYDATNNLCASLFFLNYKGRTSIHHVASNMEGMHNGAIYFILDEYIRKYSEQNLMLCIDNPAAKRISEIFLNFGSSVSNYPCIKKLK